MYIDEEFFENLVKFSKKTKSFISKLKTRCLDSFSFQNPIQLFQKTKFLQSFYQGFHLLACMHVYLGGSL